ncbi:hypothetical protein C7377_0164 [Balneicella halophila]|uniref:Uncharacterized protein n=1 Tax=Balneicella halophila TaxID=1537566 RepID=A0A7L4UQ54_BALHA|nr:hypothetical protein [Balneicella halophila]PVX51873.1 hypothetical protein C7377_0164 [Balneicella halophila]
MEENLTHKIIDTLKSKATLKQKVFDTTLNTLKLIEEIISEIEQEYNELLDGEDNRIKVLHHKTGIYDLQLKLGSDILIFSMHTNVFQFNKENIIWKHSYMKNNPDNGYVGQISIYNFLTDSFVYNRNDDIGYLVGRIFVNRENHYMVEGKRQMSFRDKDISACEVNKENLRHVIETAINYTINFDLLVPPYDMIKLSTVGQMQQKAQDNKIQTGKRLGFQFNTDDV